MNNNNPKITFIHSLNNYSGSPKMLSIVIKKFLENGWRAELFTSRGDGFLSGIRGLKYRYTCYRWTKSRPATVALLAASQAALFFRLLCHTGSRLYYVNTIVPFGAILACRLTRKRFVIHVHEDMTRRSPLYAILRNTYRACNEKSIFVSAYLKATAAGCRDGATVYNALESDFVTRASAFVKQDRKRGSHILMIASLKPYKGVYEFVEIARLLPQYSFELVLAVSGNEAAAFAGRVGPVPNLTMCGRQKDLHPFYQRARLLLQLSHPEAFTETFGLTILEAMTYAIPVIGPNAGGPLELIDDGRNGYTVNPRDVRTVVSKIVRLMDDDDRYDHFARNALAKSANFSERKMMDEIVAYTGDR